MQDNNNNNFNIEYNKIVNDMITSPDYKLKLRKKKKTIAFDADGTFLNEDAHFPEFGTPIKNVVEFMQWLYLNQFEIIIHTCRVSSDWDIPMEYQVYILESKLEEMQIPYHKIWTGVGKPYAQWYFDDLACFNPDKVKKYKHYFQNYLNLENNVKLSDYIKSCLLDGLEG